MRRVPQKVIDNRSRKTKGPYSGAFRFSQKKPPFRGGFFLYNPKRLLHFEQFDIKDECGIRADLFPGATLSVSKI